MLGNRMRVVVPAGIVAALATVLGARYATFDPQRFASDVEDALSPFQPGTVQTLHAIAAAPDSASVMPLIGAVPTDAVQHAERYARTMAALRQRFHANEGPCARYPTALADSDTTPAKIDEVADAILAAELASRIDALARTSSRWGREEDVAAHEAEHAAEIVAYFADAAGAWDRLGIAMQRGAVERAIREGAAVSAANSGPHPEREALHPDEEGRGKELRKRYGDRLLQGGLRIAERKREIDLRAPRLRLLEPGMSRAAVRARLGDADEAGGRWQYHEDRTAVTFDAQDRVTGIAVTLADSRARVVVDGKTVDDLDEAAMKRLMGKPLRDAEGEAGEAVLVYDGAPHARMLVFEGGRLTRVELWRRDLLTVPVP